MKKLLYVGISILISSVVMAGSFQDSLDSFEFHRNFIKNKVSHKNYLPTLKHMGSKTKYSVVILHGLNGSPKVMEPIAEEIYSLGLNVLNMNLPGHGYGLSSLANIEVRDFYEFNKWLIRVGKGLGEKIIFVGFSLGGATTMMAHEDHRKHLDSMVLIAPGIKFNLQNTSISCALDLLIDGIPSPSLHESVGSKYSKVPSGFFCELMTYSKRWTAKNFIDKDVLLYLSEDDELVNLKETEKFFERGMRKGRLHKKVLQERYGVKHEDLVSRHGYESHNIMLKTIRDFIEQRL